MFGLTSTVFAPLNMGWRHVLFANWPVDPEVVAPKLPSPLEVDTHEGQAWLSAVPFTNVDVRPVWVPRAIGRPLPELNLRTYVTHEGERGVYFFSLDAQGLAGVLGARVLHHLPYYYARISLDTVGDRVEFTSRRRHPGARPLTFRATYEPRGARYTADPGSLDHFLVERYRYYTQGPGGDLRYADIDHPPWSLYEAEVALDGDDLFEANGFAVPDSRPVYRYSEGVDVLASESKRV